MLDVYITVSEDTKKLEKRMADIQAAIAELKATVQTEAGQVAAKIEALTAAVLAGQVDSEAVVSQLNEIRDNVKNFIPDEPPIEPTPE